MPDHSGADAYTGQYESIIRELETNANTLLSKVNETIQAGIDHEISLGQSYPKLAAPETWSSRAIDPLNALCQKLNNDFASAVMYRVDGLAQTKPPSTSYSFSA